MSDQTLISDGFFAIVVFKSFDLWIAFSSSLLLAPRLKFLKMYSEFRASSKCSAWLIYAGEKLILCCKHGKGLPHKPLLQSFCLSDHCSYQPSYIYIWPTVIPFEIHCPCMIRTGCPTSCGPKVGHKDLWKNSLLMNQYKRSGLCFI